MTSQRTMVIFIKKHQTLIPLHLFDGIFQQSRSFKMNRYLLGIEPPQTAFQLAGKPFKSGI